MYCITNMRLSHGYMLIEFTIYIICKNDFINIEL